MGDLDKQGHAPRTHADSASSQLQRKGSQYFCNSQTKDQQPLLFWMSQKWNQTIWRVFRDWLISLDTMISSSLHFSDRNILSLFFFLNFYLMCMSFPNIWVLCCVCIQCLWKPEEDIRSPGNGVLDSFVLPHECWELSPGPFEE